MCGDNSPLLIQQSQCYKIAFVYKNGLKIETNCKHHVQTIYKISLASCIAFYLSNIASNVAENLSHQDFFFSLM